MADGLKLNLGCGMSRLEGWVNCDLYPLGNVDEAFDVQGKWPFQDGSAAEAYSSHMLEHLRDPKAFFREAWRVLRPNGQLFLRLPHGGHRAAWWDLEHIRPWFPENFAFLQPGYAAAIGNPQHDDWTAPFCVDLINIRVSAHMRGWVRWGWQRRLLVPWLDAFPNAGQELFVWLRPLKTAADLEEFRRSRVANQVPAAWSIMRHDLDGRRLAHGEAAELVQLSDFQAVNGFR